ncbi:sugar phosphate isomerase/epimerase [Candidatus Poribacteria bacterium]|nr:MAG: sugar phosphate isomerase/epimerase [Candidatus Poribacteria bacterium]
MQMQIGTMSGTFARDTLEEVLDAVANHGMNCVQFNLSSAGVTKIPTHIDEDLCDKIREEMGVRNITMTALGGTYNMIHPDAQRRADGVCNLRVLAAACERLGTSVITLCTGSRDPDNMWRRHPDNDTPEAWDDLVVSMRQAIEVAEEYQVTLAFEPEVANVVDSAIKARRIIDQIGSPYLKIVMDGANIFHTGELPRMREILDEAFALLGEHIAFAHAKDLDRDGEAGHLAAGKGLLDYDQYLSLLNNVDPDVPIILHGLSEAEVDGCVSFLREKIEAINT